MANWFPLALKPNARSWLMNHPAGSVSSWQDLCDQFVSGFQGRYKHPSTISVLHLLIQKTDETLHKYIQRFIQVQHSISYITQDTVIATFHANVRNPKMCEKTNTRQVQTVSKLFQPANKCAHAEEGHRVPGEADDVKQPQQEKESEAEAKKQCSLRNPTPRKPNLMRSKKR